VGSEEPIRPRRIGVQRVSEDGIDRPLLDNAARITSRRAVGEAQ